MTRPLTIGVLGGMGPDATLDFFARLLAADPGAKDQDRIRVLIDNNPGVPDRNEAIAGRGASPGPVLASMARGLELSGADFLVMPCNAAHAFANDIVAAVSVPFLSIIEETARETLRVVPGLTRVGVLAAAGSLDASLYPRALGAHGVEALEPVGESRTLFMELLYRIKRGDIGEQTRRAMAGLAGQLIDRGAQAVIAGCTEVPLVLDPADIDRPLVNSTAVLARAAVAFARQGEAADPSHDASVERPKAG